MVEANCDIRWWQPVDFLGVGLQFHLVHHLYPRMPREHFRAATKDVHEHLCRTNGLEFREVSYLEGVWGMLSQLDKVSVLATAAQGMQPSL